MASAIPSATAYTDYYHQENKLTNLCMYKMDGGNKDAPVAIQYQAYHCPTCWTRFSLLCLCEDHIKNSCSLRKHKAENLYLCPDCDASFCSPSNRKRHLATQVCHRSRGLSAAKHQRLMQQQQHGQEAELRFALENNIGHIACLSTKRPCPTITMPHQVYYEDTEAAPHQTIDQNPQKQAGCTEGGTLLDAGCFKVTTLPHPQDNAQVAGHLSSEVSDCRPSSKPADQWHEVHLGTTIPKSPPSPLRRKVHGNRRCKRVPQQLVSQIDILDW